MNLTAHSRCSEMKRISIAVTALIYLLAVCKPAQGARYPAYELNPYARSLLQATCPAQCSINGTLTVPANKRCIDGGSTPSTFCTGDSVTANFTAIDVTSICAGTDSFATLRVQIGIRSTLTTGQTTRQDVNSYISTNGVAPNVPGSTCVVTTLNATSGCYSNTDGDGCGDATTTTSNCNVPPLTVKCVDSGTSDGLLAIHVCSSWNEGNNAQNVCDGPAKNSVNSARCQCQGKNSCDSEVREENDMLGDHTIDPFPCTSVQSHGCIQPRCTNR
jgi:hypothetical protein